MGYRSHHAVATLARLLKLKLASLDLTKLIHELAVIVKEVLEGCALHLIPLLDLLQQIELDLLQIRRSHFIIFTNQSIMETRKYIF